MKSRTPNLALLAPVLAVLCGPGCRSVPPAGSLTLVETVPVETNLGLPGLPDTTDVWVELVEGAQERVELSHFYASGETGSRLTEVVRALEAAAERGVAVRFLADERFYGLYPELLDRFARHPGMQVRRIDLGPVSGGVQHAKYMVVDGARLFLGSPNFDWRALEHIQELGVRVESVELAQALGDVFEHDWALAGGEAPPAGRPAVDAVTLTLGGRQVPEGAPAEVLARPAFSPQGLLPDPNTWDLPQLLAQLDGAQASYRLQCLTFDLERDGERFEAFERALLAAAERGVAVQLLVAEWCLRQGVVEGLQELAARPGIEVRFVRVPQASRGFIPYARVIHSKFAVADGCAGWIGTSNLERGYFYESRNVGLVLEGAGIGRLLDARFEATWRSPYAEELDPAGRYEAPRRE